MRGLVQLRRVVNVAAPLGLIWALVLAAIPRGELEGGRLARHDRLVELMRPLSLSQSWGMYAPDAARSHRYLILEAHDADGRVRALEESEALDQGWGTVRGWARSRRDIWRVEITRSMATANRNRTWYLRGVCLREARRGHEVEHLQLRLASRSLRSPEQVRAGRGVLGPLRVEPAGRASCRVGIIRKMIARDRERLAEKR